MAMLVGHWQLRGFGMWALEARSTGAFVGRAGLHFPDGWPAREVAWALARPWWGRGYAFEAAVAALDYAFQVLRWPRAISLIDPQNERSIRLAERLGERFERTVPLRGHTVSMFAITRGRWEDSPARRRASPFVPGAEANFPVEVARSARADEVAPGPTRPERS